MNEPEKRDHNLRLHAPRRWRRSLPHRLLETIETLAIGWDAPTSATRTCKVFGGKVDLADPVWIEVNDNVELYWFFKVEVRME